MARFNMAGLSVSSSRVANSLLCLFFHYQHCHSSHLHFLPQHQYLGYLLYSRCLYNKCSLRTSVVILKKCKIYILGLTSFAGSAAFFHLLFKKEKNCQQLFIKISRYKLVSNSLSKTSLVKVAGAGQNVSVRYANENTHRPDLNCHTNTTFDISKPVNIYTMIKAGKQIFVKIRSI